MPPPPPAPLQNKLGGGEGVEGLYGSIKRGGMDKVLECLRDKCCLDSRSVLVDIGAGLGRCCGGGGFWRLLLHTHLPHFRHQHCPLAALHLQALGLSRPCLLLTPLPSLPSHFPALPCPKCRPLMHALLEPGIAGATGVEIDRIKCDKADAFLRQAVLELQRRGVAPEGLVPPPIQCSAIEDVSSPGACACWLAVCLLAVRPLAACLLSCIGRSSGVSAASLGRVYGRRHLPALCLPVVTHAACAFPC